MIKNDKNILKVKIFGTDYPVKVDAKLEYVQKVAKYVDSKMIQVNAAKPNKPLHQIAIFAALNIADELFQQKNLEHKNLNQFEDKINSLAQKLELGITKYAEDNSDYLKLDAE